MNELALNFNQTIINENTTNFSQMYFQKFITDNRINQKTMENYFTYLKHFANWIKQEGIKNPTRENIREYKKHLDSYISEKTGNLLTDTSKQQYFQVVKTFFKFLENEDLYKDITKGIKSYKIDRTEERKRAFQEEEILTILYQQFN